jgi:hypothetical protein
VGIRLLVVDDNPHERWEGRVHPSNATFERFATGLLDLPGRPVASIASCLPIRDASGEPASPPLDERISVVPTAPFDGIEGYLRNLPAMVRRNRPIFRRAAGMADLVWLKIPASNAALARAAAREAGIPCTTWVAGRATSVGAATGSGVRRLGGAAVGAAYDAIGLLAGLGGERIVVGDVASDGGDAVMASLVEGSEIVEPRGPWPAIPWRPRLAWAGRLARGKGIEALLRALAALAEPDGPRYELVLVGTGPAAAELDALARHLGVAERIHVLGFIGDRATYLSAIRSADLFVFPSPAEGFPKVVLDAMAVGLPVLARPVGGLAPLARSGTIAGAPGDPERLAASVRSLVADPERAMALRAAGHAYVLRHTRDSELRRVVARWRARWPTLPW